MNRSIRTWDVFVLSGYVVVSLSACGDKPQAGGISPQALVDAVHTVLEADRTVYARMIVNRLQDEEKVIKASEHWKDDRALPLPAQVLRMSAELVAEQGAPFSYALLSLWPINKQNAAKTKAEKTGLQFVADNPGKNYYAEETLGKIRYLTAVYPDKAVSQACITCHNEHKDSPKSDFKLGDTMGGVVVRIPLKG
jgi:hypothetical protein